MTMAMVARARSAIGRGRRDAIGRVERHLAHEGAAVELVQQHVERALVARPAAVPDASLALGDVALDLGGPQSLATRQAQGEAREARDGGLHAPWPIPWWGR